nr:hypothetical protein MFMH1_34410 [Myxococcus sp. MH1]
MNPIKPTQEIGTTTNYSRNTIQSITSTWDTRDWENKAPKLSTGTLDDTARSLFVSEVQKYLQKGQIGRAYNWALLALHLSQGEILEHAKFTDSFRPSKHPPHALPKLSSLLQRLSNSISILLPSTPTSTKLDSIANYTKVIADTQTDKHHLLQALKSPSRPALSILTLVEYQFSGLHSRATWYSSPTLPTGLKDLTLEESASAASFALDTLNKSTPLSFNQFKPFTHIEDSPEKAEGILLSAHRLRELKEMEASIFRLNYRFTKTAKNTYIHTAESDRIGMSVALGYIKNQWMTAIKNAPADYSEAASLKDTFKLWFEKFGNQIVQVTSDKIPRIRLAIPVDHVKHLGELILSKRRFFREEMHGIHNACYELGTNFSDMEALKVTPDLSLFDILAISRLLRLVFFARLQKLIELRDSNIVAMWNSSLLGIPDTSLVEIITAAGFSPQQAESYIEIFTWNPQNSEQLVDLQYRPFIRFGKTIAIPLAIHLTSNIFRNPLITENKRFYADGADDPISHYLEEALRTKTPLTALNVKYRHKKKEGDIDVLAVLDGKLYIFECKNTILPTSTTEQQTTLGRIQKGVEQLDRFLALWKDKEFRTTISQKTGYNLNQIDEVRTAIVLGNRIFSGASFGKHPVRHNRELENIIKHGKTTSWPPDGPPQEINQWKGDTFSSHDLDDYLSDDSKLYGQLWRSFEALDKPLPFSNTLVLRRDFVLIQEKFLAELGISQTPTSPSPSVPPAI